MHEYLSQGRQEVFKKLPPPLKEMSSDFFEIRTLGATQVPFQTRRPSAAAVLLFPLSPLPYLCASLTPCLQMIYRVYTHGSRRLI